MVLVVAGGESAACGGAPGDQVGSVGRGSCLNRRGAGRQRCGCLESEVSVAAAGSARAAREVVVLQQIGSQWPSLVRGWFGFAVEGSC